MLPGELDVGEESPELETFRLDPVELLLHHLVLVRHLPHRLVLAVLRALGDAPPQLGHVLAHLDVLDLQLLDTNIR